MDLPWAETLDELRLGPHRIPVFGIQSRFNVTRQSNVTVVATFARTGGPAVTSARIARGRAIYVGMLPGLGTLSRKRRHEQAPGRGPTSE